MRFCSECGRSFEPKSRTIKTCSSVCSKKRELRLRREKQLEKKLATEHYKKKVKNITFNSHGQKTKRNNEIKVDEEKNKEMIEKFLSLKEPSVKFEDEKEVNEYFRRYE